jgi:hypothetical protein
MAGKCAGTQDAKHIAKVGTDTHFDVLNNIAKGFATFDNAFFQHHQTFSNKMMSSGFFGNINQSYLRKYRYWLLAVRQHR